ncbi:MAG: 3-deoxy-7-phosphoheptulonate synthase, partial [Microbacteriaceae bacterium]|nr:3-deoxy-7-phosphoheptulonate synthase [Microbacteriaceae bacterium]
MSGHSPERTPLDQPRGIEEPPPVFASNDDPVVLADPSVIAGLDHWRTLPIKQQPEWPDASAVQAASDEIASLPPLIFAGEVDVLREHLPSPARGQAFLLQGGDCAENFAAKTGGGIRGKVWALLQVTVELAHGARVP